MKAALELGRWVFLAPIGYLNAPRSIGKSLIHDPERAPLVRRAFEDYASGRFTKEQLLKQVRTWGLTNRRGKPLTSQAIGVRLRNRLYAGAYYHCRPGCRAVNVSKAELEGMFADELALLQPTPAYMRLLKESVRQVWKARKFPDGIAFDGNRSVRTGAATAAFSYLQGIETGNEGLVDQNGASWNRVTNWLRRVDRLQQAG